MTSKNYEKAGVSIAAGEALVEKIKKINPDIGGFAGLYPLDKERSLVACTDGVGTKLELGIAMERFEELGQDLVAMCVNDLIVCGARPLFFLDYFATGRLDVHVAHRVVQGIAEACRRSHCVLLGGETAEMPGFYEEKKFDLAGFAVGEVFNRDLVDGKSICEGDVIMGLPSSGFHANGYSLVRKILREHSLSLESPFPGGTLGELLTVPTHLYVDDILSLTKHVKVKGMAHVTGGGLANLTRVLPPGLSYHIDTHDIPTPYVIKYIQEIGKIEKEEAFTVWNMGLGFAIVIDPGEQKNLQEKLPHAFFVGHIAKNRVLS